MRDITALRVVKTVHTVIWAFFVACIVAIPLFTSQDDFRHAMLATGLVFVEVLVLLFNRWRCPLTPLAARFTTEQADNFDIYLPEWVARHNKVIFGGLYAVGVLYMVVRWILA